MCGWETLGQRLRAGALLIPTHHPAHPCRTAHNHMASPLHLLHIPSIVNMYTSKLHVHPWCGRHWSNIAGGARSSHPAHPHILPIPAAKRTTHNCSNLQHLHPPGALHTLTKHATTCALSYLAPGQHVPASASPIQPTPPTQHIPQRAHTHCHPNAHHNTPPCKHKHTQHTCVSEHTKAPAMPSAPHHAQGWEVSMLARAACGGTSLWGQNLEQLLKKKRKYRGGTQLGKYRGGEHEHKWASMHA